MYSLTEGRLYKIDHEGGRFVRAVRPSRKAAHALPGDPYPERTAPAGITYWRADRVVAKGFQASGQPEACWCVKAGGR